VRAAPTTTAFSLTVVASGCAFAVTVVAVLWAVLLQACNVVIDVSDSHITSIKKDTFVNFFIS
jgi:hypothetical protein